jgi:CARDB
MGVKRYAAVCAIVCALGGVAASSVGASKPPRARVTGLTCQHALDPPARAVSITAVMRPLHGTKRMQMRFQLLSRAKGAAAYTPVTGGDLGTWVSPATPTLGQRPGDVWKLQKPIVGLAAPASYRFRVSFRWLGAHGHVLGTSVRESRGCFQPELRPDLLVQSITVEPVPGRPNVNLNRYVAVIRNAGASDTGPFEILFTPGGALPVQTVSVSDLTSHTKLVKGFLGPVCSNAAATTVTVDPEDKVDDFNRSNNSMTAVCPGG